MIKVPEDLLFSEIYFLVDGQLPSKLCSYRAFPAPQHMYKHMCTHVCTHTHMVGGTERDTFSSYKAIYLILRALPSSSSNQLSKAFISTYYYVGV